jgi:5-bromo-4-chloroindolyl phosphate hydrolysis protein
MAGEPVPIRRPTPPPLAPSPLAALATRVRRRVAPAKSLALFVLPSPLVAAGIGALVADQPARLAIDGAALACFWTAGVLVWHALVAEARYLFGEQMSLPRVPWKLTSGLLTAVGSGLAATAGGHPIAGAATFGVIGALGHLTFYGRDLRPARLEVATIDGIDMASVTEQLEQASGRLRRIDAAARAIGMPEFRDRLARITQIGRDIVAEMARDPRDVSRGRRFLHLYLDSTERVTEEYARTHHRTSLPLDDNFRRLLIEMESAFAEQHRRLLDSDALSLDVDIEVLTARLKREGLGAYMEKPS